MSRFDCDFEDGMPWGLWEKVVSNALVGRRGQEALAAIEEALLALPEPKLIEGHLARDGQVCAIGALVAHRRAKAEGVDISAVIAAMDKGVRCWCRHAMELHTGNSCRGDGWDGEPCVCSEYDPVSSDVYDTTEAGKAEGLSNTVAWHLAYINDEQWAGATPEERYDRLLGFVRRAQGKEPVGASR